MLGRSASGSLTIYFEGHALTARNGDSVAAALLANKIAVTRVTAPSGSPRGPFCMMGACFDCVAIVDGKPAVQTCLTPVRNGMRIERQKGARELAMPAWTAT
ncbi:MAG TPA: (2Fe-2S)-binding protein [Acetobacteraceae bacterium]|jgi:sarcosine oxidase subunit alpha